MQKRAPTLANILVIVLFALSCFGLILFLWESFGGPVPLKPKGYRFTAIFPRTFALAEQSDVRISGVNVGHVISLKHATDGDTHALIEISSKYAPIPSNMQAMLRQKTLLGETFVQLTPQGSRARALPDDGQLSRGQVEPSVTLDDILSALNPETRKSFQVWVQSQAEGLGDRGEQVNASFAEIQPFVEDANKLVTIANSQEGALRAVVHNTGVVFDALTEREGQFRGFIANGERTFHAAAESSQAFAAAIRALPTFESRSQTALRSLDKFATNTSPLLDQLKPVERQLTSLLGAAKPFTPPFNSLLTALGPFTKAAKKGLPDVKKELELTVPVLGASSPLLHNLNPVLQYTSEYVPELQGLFANVTAATQIHEKNTNFGRVLQQHELRAMQVLEPEGLSIYQQRIGTNRANPYPKPGAFRLLSSGLPVFSSASCSNSAPSLSGPTNEVIPSKETLEELISKGVVNSPEDTVNKVAAPPCNQQEPFTFEGLTSQFPHAVPSK